MSCRVLPCPVLPTLCLPCAQNISSYLSWTDVLAVRATARHWASALAPVVTRLRVPLVNPTSLHKRPAAAGADEEADADAGAAKHPFSTAGQAADASAGALKAQPHPVEQLSAVLERLPNVDSITLVLSTATSGPDLEGALQVIGRKVGSIDATAHLDGCQSTSKKIVSSAMLQPLTVEPAMPGLCLLQRAGKLLKMSSLNPPIAGAGQHCHHLRGWPSACRVSC